VLLEEAHIQGRCLAAALQQELDLVAGVARAVGQVVAVEVVALQPQGMPAHWQAVTWGPASVCLMLLLVLVVEEVVVVLGQHVAVVAGRVEVGAEDGGAAETLSLRCELPALSGTGRRCSWQPAVQSTAQRAG
jgi:hypothetical protein